MLQKQGGSIMSSVKVFVPYGAVGLNCTEEAFEAGLAMKPDIISSDAGSTDSGPYYLGSGHGKYSIADVKRDLKQHGTGCRQAGHSYDHRLCRNLWFRRRRQHCPEADPGNLRRGRHPQKDCLHLLPAGPGSHQRKNIVKAKFPPSTVHRKSPKKPLMSAAPS